MESKQRKTVDNRIAKEKQKFLEILAKNPIVQIACERSGVSKPTLYRWKQNDKKFSISVDQAIIEGESLITDMSESQLIGLIKDRNFPAIQLWLKSHHPKYGNKLEITGKINIEDEPLTSEEAKIRSAALRLVAFDKNHDKQEK